MEAFDWGAYLIDNGPFAVFGGLIIWYLSRQLTKREEKIDDLEKEIRDSNKFQIDLLKDSQSLLTLVDDKLSSDRGTNEVINEIHAIVKRIADDIEKLR